MSGYNPLGEQTNLSTQEVQSDPQAGPVTCATSSDHNQETEGQGRKTLPIVSLYICSPHFSCLSTPFPETTREVYDNERFSICLKQTKSLCLVLMTFVYTFQL